MKHLYELLNKKYDKKLVEDKEYRKAWKKRKTIQQKKYE